MSDDLSESYRNIDCDKTKDMYEEFDKRCNENYIFFTSKKCIEDPGIDDDNGACIFILKSVTVKVQSKDNAVLMSHELGHLLAHIDDYRYIIHDDVGILKYFNSLVTHPVVYHYQDNYGIDYRQRLTDKYDQAMKHVDNNKSIEIKDQLWILDVLLTHEDTEDLREKLENNYENEYKPMKEIYDKYNSKELHDKDTQKKLCEDVWREILKSAECEWQSGLQKIGHLPN